MNTSQKYDFQSSFTFEKIVDNAYMRVGKSPALITPQDVDFCRDIANMELRQWQAKHVALCFVQRELFTFVDNEVFYKVPNYIYRPLEITKISFVSQTLPSLLSGNAVASEGNATPCFNPALTTGLTQTSPNGWMGYQFNNTYGSQSIWYIGILTLVKRTYTLDIEYSLDGTNWQTAKKCPQEAYYPLETRWWVAEFPQVAPYWRVRETNGATLSIQQIYFNTPNPAQGDITIGKICRASFLNYPQKINNMSTPTTVYYNEKVPRSLYVYGNFYSAWQGMVYTARVYAQDVDQLFQNVDLDAKFYRSLVACLAYNLALQNSSRNLPDLKADYDEVYNTMADDDGEDVPMTMSVNLGQNWTNV